MREHSVHLVTCPDNHKTAAVKPAWLGSGLGSCSRWPEKEGCGQECLRQLESGQESCLLRDIVTQWYDEKSCAFCSKPIGEIVWHERPPALRAPDGSTLTWKDVRPDQLLDLFATHRACCWPCHVRESFRREHPDLVLERPRPVTKRRVLQPSTAVY